MSAIEIDDVVDKPKKRRIDGGTRCAAWGCDKSKLKDGVGVFEFPNRDKSPERFNFWCRVVKHTRQDFRFVKGTSRLCSDHFDDDQIDNYMYLKILKETNPDQARKTKWRLVQHARPSPALMPKRPIHGTPTTPETSDRSKRSDKRSQAVAVEVTPSRPRPRKSRPAKLERKRTVDAALFEAQVAEIENAENMKPEPMQLDLETEVDNKPAEPKSVDAFVQVSRRMPHRSIKVQIAPKTFTQGTQTDIPCCQPCRCQRSDENLIADCLTDKADAMSECDSDEDDQEFNDINVDPDYESDSGDESTDDEINFSDVQNEKDEDPVSERKYLVFHSCLMMLFATCAICSSETSQFIKRIGTFLSVTQCCTNKECGFVRKWDSQPKYGNLAAGNVLLSSAILFAGANPSKILHVLRLLGCQSIGRTTFSQQKEHLWPAVETVWTEEQDSLLTEIKERESSLVVGGDGRADTPGHSAKY